MEKHLVIEYIPRDASPEDRVQELSRIRDFVRSWYGIKWELTANVLVISTGKSVADVQSDVSFYLAGIRPKGEVKVGLLTLEAPLPTA